MNLNIPPNYINSNASTPIKQDGIVIDFLKISKGVKDITLTRDKKLKKEGYIENGKIIKNNIEEKELRKLLNGCSETSYKIFLLIIDIYERLDKEIYGEVIIPSVRKFCKDNKISRPEFDKAVKEFNSGLYLIYKGQEGFLVLSNTILTFKKLPFNKYGYQVILSAKLLIKGVERFKGAYYSFNKQLLKGGKGARTERTLHYFIFRSDNFYKQTNKKPKISIKNFAKKNNEEKLLRDLGITKYKREVLEIMEEIDKKYLGGIASKVEGDFFILPNIENKKETKK